MGDLPPSHPPLNPKLKLQASQCPVSQEERDKIMKKQQSVAQGGCDSTTLSTPSLPAVGDVFPDATRSAGQLRPLSAQKTVSNIPKGGENVNESHWVFPSPQRFYNAMKKKGWEPREEDMAAIVSIHNTVNNQCWKEVLKYESFHAECEQPKLVRFKGMPDELSPKARIKSFFGARPPFDRHDWVVDRCGKEVLYVIDFYEGDESTGSGASDAPAIYLDVRPAVSFSGVYDRIKMGLFHTFGLFR